MPSSRLALPRPPLTIRTRLAAIYGGLILATGFALLTVVYLLLRRNVDAKAESIEAELAKKSAAGQVPGAGDTLGPAGKGAGGTGPGGNGLGGNGDKVDIVASQSGYDTLQHLVVVSGISLAGFALLALVVGWWMAGHVVAPVHRITSTARELSWQNLGARIRLAGPRDELKELADTFDAMLARLEAAFESQRRFIANASHELRTPLGIQRTVIQLGLADPSPEELARVRGHLLDANRRTEHLIEGLLLLAQCESGLPHRTPVALGELVGEVVTDHSAAAAAAGVDIRAHISAATVAGDRVLLGQLAANLVRNAIRYNHPGGVVDVSVEPGGLVVANTGPRVPVDRVDELFEPFTRLGARRSGAAEGAGLGLSIVRSIAHAHEGTVAAVARAGGGLEVRVSLPAAESRPGERTPPPRPDSDQDPAGQVPDSSTLSRADNAARNSGCG
jgi:signal transduction histidine kinase